MWLVIVLTAGAILSGIVLSELVVWLARERPFEMFAEDVDMDSPELAKAKAYSKCGQFHHGPLAGFRCLACNQKVDEMQAAECLHVRQQTLKIMADALTGAKTK